MRYLLLLLLAWSCQAQISLRNPAFVSSLGAVASVPATYNFVENFEGTGYENATWTETLNGGTVDEDGTGTVLQGSQSLIIADTSAPIPNTISPNFTSATVTHYCFLFQFSSNPAAATDLFQLRSVGNFRAKIDLNTTRRLRVYGSVGGTGSAVSPALVLSTGTKYFIWLTVDQTASPETFTMAVSSDGVKPTSGDGYATGTSDDGAGTHNNILFYGGANNTVVYDRFLVSTNAIGSNP